jgi:hypothetical protein
VIANAQIYASKIYANYRSIVAMRMNGLRRKNVEERTEAGIKNKIKKNGDFRYHSR